MAKTSWYEKLKKEYPVIARHVKAFPEAVQLRAFETLYNAFLAELGAPPAAPISSGVVPNQPKGLNRVAELLENGNIEVTARDLKANSLEDAVRRLVYVTIRANELLTGKKSIESKVVRNLLKKNRLWSGSAQNALTRIAGIIEVGNDWSLDGPAKDEADKYIREANDDSIHGKFKPGSISRPRKKESTSKLTKK